jgi:dihydroflavonol-4-reductase
MVPQLQCGLEARGRRKTMPDTVLVTGASGFVGSAVARILAARGFAVRVLVRRESPRGNLAGLDATIVEGDMREPHDMRAAMEGVRYLFHVAADYRLWAKDPEDIVRNNVAGTRAVMQAARDAKAERIVYTSSVATLKPGTLAAPSSEAERLASAQAIGAYKRSKVLAERLVEHMVDEDKLPAVIVNPSTPIGPRDIKPTPTGRIIVEAASGRIPAFVDTGLNLVHVDDVAEGHVQALAKGATGASYILGGENVSLKEMLHVIARTVGRNPPLTKLPRTPLYPLAWAAEGFARLSGREPFITIDALKMSAHHMFFSSEKAKTDIGYTARPYTLAISDAVNWFRMAGMIP